MTTIVNVLGAEAAVERVEIDHVRDGLERDGYYVARVPPQGERAATFVLDLARQLGDLFVPSDCDPSAPVIRTAPTRKRHVAPFDRPEAIGWHGDFSTYEDRPELSLVYVTRPDPRGGDAGAWRLASVKDVVAELENTSAGREALDFLKTTLVPFTYSEEEPPRSFLVFERRPNDRMGLRFYPPSIRRGCIVQYGEVPGPVASALAQLESAADRVCRTVPTREGSLLIISNWFALHDRTPQTISRKQAKREALLCFVKHTGSAAG